MRVERVWWLLHCGLHFLVLRIMCGLYRVIARFEIELSFCVIEWLSTGAGLTWNAQLRL